MINGWILYTPPQDGLTISDADLGSQMGESHAR